VLLELRHPLPHVQKAHRLLTFKDLPTARYRGIKSSNSCGPQWSIANRLQGAGKP
jgi:hypothetical protein